MFGIKRENENKQTSGLLFVFFFSVGWLAGGVAGGGCWAVGEQEMFALPCLMHASSTQQCPHAFFVAVIACLLAWVPKERKKRKERKACKPQALLASAESQNPHNPSVSIAPCALQSCALCLLSKWVVLCHLNQRFELAAFVVGFEQVGGWVQQACQANRLLFALWFFGFLSVRAQNVRWTVIAGQSRER